MVRNGHVRHRAELTSRPTAVASRRVKVSVRLVQYLGSPPDVVDLAVLVELGVTHVSLGGPLGPATLAEANV